MTEFSIIAAVSENNVIGNRNTLPWRIPEDLARFKALTLGHTLVMGRKTFESIGRPLPGRTTLVLTRREDFAVPGVLVAHDRDAAVALAPGTHVFVAGGADIYAQFLPLVTRMYLTRVDGTYEGDTYFPPFDAAGWKLVSSERSRPAAPGTPRCTFDVYERASAPFLQPDSKMTHPPAGNSP